MPTPTLFLTISRGGTARNLLKTDVYRLLLASGMRVVILTPAWEDPRFVKEFSAPNVAFAPLFETDWTRRDLFFTGLAKALVYNASTEMRDRYGIFSPTETNAARYWFKRIVFRPLRNIGWLKEAVRWLDALLVPDRYYRELFDRYQPTAIFSSSVMEDVDVYVMKQARARNIPIIAMPKSWDNLSKMCVRVKPDRMIVWAEYSRGEALRFQHMKSSSVVKCGSPQFDAYHDERLVDSREDFCRRFGLDPAKKIILYASEGRITKHDPDLVDMLLKGLDDGRYGVDAQLFIRPHFIYKNDADKFVPFSGRHGVVIDDTYQPSSGFRDSWDYSDAQTRHVVNLLRHSDLLITSCSTMTLDAAAFDLPSINVAFDGYAVKPFAYSIAKWCTTEYYRHVSASGAPWDVRSEPEFHAAVHRLLNHPEERRAERAMLLAYFCGSPDGRASERIGRTVVDFVFKRGQQLIPDPSSVSNTSG